MKKLIVFLIISITLSSCDNIPKEKTNLSLNEFIYFTMKDNYLWYDKIPSLNYNNYSTPEALIDALMYKKIDKWSYIVKIDTKSTNLSENQYFGYGYGFIWSNENNKDVLRVNFVFDNSPAYNGGLRRGQKIIKINNYTIPENPTDDEKNLVYDEMDKGDSISFVIVDITNNQKNISLSKGTVTQNIVLYKNIYYKGDKRIGYLVYYQFTDFSETELIDTFGYFKDNGVNEIIIDLRYNGGGSVDVCSKFANLLAGYNFYGKIFEKMVSNDRRLQNTINIFLKKETNSINLKRIFFITTNQSASASEALINGLKPFMSVKLIGGKTHGKPVGMAGQLYKDYLFFPITFRGYNANDEGDFFDGIPVDKEAADDVKISFGDESDDCLKQALYYIENSSFSPNLIQRDIYSNKIIQNKPFEYKNYNKFLNSF